MNSNETSQKQERLRLLQTLSVASFICLTIDVLVWESWGSPPAQVSVYFGLTMKLLPLLLVLVPIWRGNAQVYMWVSLLMLLYLMEGLVLSYSEFQYGWGLHNELLYAVIELGFSAAFIFFAGSYIKLKNPRIPKLKRH